MKKDFKKLIAILLVVLMVAGLVACSGTDKPEETKAPAEDTTTAPAGDQTEAPVDDDKDADDDTDAPTGGGEKVAFICHDMANPSQAYSSKQFEMFAADYDFDIVIMDAKGDAQTESQLVTNAIAQDIKAIFLNPNDIKAIVPAVMQAKEAGLVIGLFSSDLEGDATQYRDFYTGVDDIMAGEAAAQAFIDNFPDGAKIVEIGGQAGHSAQIRRHDGFSSVIEGSNIEVLEVQNTQLWDTAQAMAIMEDFDTKYGDEIDGIFCHWDNGVTGVIEALKATGHLEGMFIVGVDGNAHGFSQVKDGTQTISIAQNFTTMTKNALSLARRVLDGETVDEINFIDLDVVTIDNIDTFPTPEW